MYLRVLRSVRYNCVRTFLENRSSIERLARPNWNRASLGGVLDDIFMTRVHWISSVERKEDKLHSRLDFAFNSSRTNPRAHEFLSLADSRRRIRARVNENKTNLTSSSPRE